MRPSKYNDKSKRKPKKKENVSFAQQSDPDGTDTDAGSTSDFGFVQVAKYTAKTDNHKPQGPITDDNFDDSQDPSYSFMQRGVPRYAIDTMDEPSDC